MVTAVTMWPIYLVCYQKYIISICISIHYVDIASLFIPLRSHGHNCDRDRLSVDIRPRRGDALRFAGRKPKGNREKDGTFLSFAYTQIIVLLYANDCATILKLKRFSKRWTMYTRFITPLVIVTVPSIEPHSMVFTLGKAWLFSRLIMSFVTETCNSSQKWGGLQLFYGLLASNRQNI